MKQSLVRCAVRISPQQLAKIEELASRENRSPSDVIRPSIDAYAGNGRLSLSELRHLRVTEYVQIAMDHIIRQDYPEDRDRLIAQTDLRMEQHHGA